MNTRYVFLIPDTNKHPCGGIMNIIRHATLAMRLGAEVVIATDSGTDPHSRRWFPIALPHIRWAERREHDICLIPDFLSARIASVAGPCILYLQSPRFLYTDFDATRDDLQIWTDSPMMLRKCRRLYPAREIPIVPNIIDNVTFRFIPQRDRTSRRIIAYPRKGALPFIKQVFKAYRRAGGSLFRLRLVDGVPFAKLSQIFRQGQLFLAAADVEGCALPPQEAMAAGVVVLGKDADGANFCMRHRETAMVADVPDDAARYLRELESLSLREHLAENAYAYITRYFPDAEPTAWWSRVLSGATPTTCTKYIGELFHSAPASS